MNAEVLYLSYPFWSDGSKGLMRLFSYDNCFVTYA